MRSTGVSMSMSPCRPMAWAISAADQSRSKPKPKAPFPLKNWGESLTESTDLTPTPKRPICPPRLRETLMRRIVSAPSGVTGVPSFAQ